MTTELLLYADEMLDEPSELELLWYTAQEKGAIDYYTNLVIEADAALASLEQERTELERRIEEARRGRRKDLTNVLSYL